MVCGRSNMRGFSSLVAIAAVVSTTSGAIVPLDLVHASSSHALSSPTVHARPSNNDYPFDWALASSLAGLTGTSSTVIVHDCACTKASSVIANTLSTTVQSPSKADDTLMATKVAGSSSNMAQATTTAASASTPSYVSFNVS